MKFDRLSDEELRELAQVLEVKNRYEREHKAEFLYPDTGPFRRSNYPKHLEFFTATSTHKEVGAVCANRVGKTFMSTYAMSSFLTGIYTDWWPGRRFNKPTRCWVSGTTAETTKDILQFGLLGPPGHLGEGMIQKDRIGKLTSRPGIPGAWDSVQVKHSTGGWSYLGFKSYNQGRVSFEGTAMDVIHLDEEPEMDIYGECLLRTMTTRGLIMLTMTPLGGLSDVVLSFLPDMRPGEE